jgi:hypothetical protein
MIDLGPTIRDYYESVGEPVTAAEAMARAARTDLGPRRTIRPHRAIAFASAALVLALAVGLAALLLPGEPSVVDEPEPTGTSQVTVSTTPPTVAPTTAAPPTTGVPPTTTLPVAQGPMTWSRMPFDGPVSAVAAADSGLMAVGKAADSAAMWTSPDGRTWTRIALDETVFGGYRISALTAGPDGYAAIGVGGTEIVAWTSPDGLEWARTSVVTLEPDSIGGIAINGLTHGPSGFVAVGWTTQRDLSYLLDDHIVIHSADGMEWQRVDTAGLPPGGMKDVAAGGPGYVVVGIDWSDRSNSKPGVWTSSDGLDWTLNDGADIEGGPGHSAGMEWLEASDDGRLYAAGLGPLWVSNDGSTWSRLGEYVGEPEDGFNDTWGGWSSSGVFSGNRIVLVGGLEFGGGEESDRAAVWGSEDGGGTWERMSRPLEVFGGGFGSTEMGAVAEIGGTYVAFGDWNDEASVWTGYWNEEDGS